MNEVLAKVEEKKAAEAAGSTAGTAGNTEGAAGAGSDGADSGKAVIDIEPKAEITFEDLSLIHISSAFSGGNLQRRNPEGLQGKWGSVLPRSCINKYFGVYTPVYDERDSLCGGASCFWR